MVYVKQPPYRLTTKKSRRKQVIRRVVIRMFQMCHSVILPGSFAHGFVLRARAYFF